MKFKNEKNLLFVDFIKIYFEKKKSFIFHIVSREREICYCLISGCREFSSNSATTTNSTTT